MSKLWDKLWYNPIVAKVSWAALVQFDTGKRWLIPKLHPLVRLAGVVLAVLLLIFLLMGGASWMWSKYHASRDDLSPIITLATAIAAGWFALMRHFAATHAELERRVTESYSKAVEQLSSDKIEMRLGGIYTLERISRESPDDYWTIMETLTAFVRERARWKEPHADASETLARFCEGDKADQAAPPTDVAAVLAVIVRRPEKEREREARERWQLDLRGADLRGAHLSQAHLEGANLNFAHLEGANLWMAHFEHALLNAAYLNGANLVGAYLHDAHLRGAHLDGANLLGGLLQGANLVEVNFNGANLRSTDLSRTDLRRAQYLLQKQLDLACGTDAELPEGLTLKTRPDGEEVAAPLTHKPTLKGASVNREELPNHKAQGTRA